MQLYRFTPEALWQSYQSQQMLAGVSGFSLLRDGTLQTKDQWVRNQSAFLTLLYSYSTYILAYLKESVSFCDI